MRFYLSNSPNDLVKLKGNLLYEIVTRAIEIQGDGKSLADVIGVRYSKLRKFTCRKSRRTAITLKDLNKILEFLHNKNSRGWDNIAGKSIESLGRNRLILYPRFPVDFSTNTATALIADLLTDGSLSYPRGDFAYINTTEENIVNNVKDMNLLLCKYYVKAKTAREAVLKSRIKCKLYRYVPSQKGRRPYYVLKYPLSIGKFFLALGIPPGERVYTDPKIPEFIFGLKSESQKSFLERAIINEGYVKPKVISIGHSKAIIDDKPPNLVLGYSRLFNNLGIRTSKPSLMKIYKTLSGAKRAYWRITITGHHLDIIKDNFNLNQKNSEIAKRNFPIMMRQHERIEQIINEVKKRKSIKARELAKSLGVSTSLISMYAKDLEDTGLIRREKIGVDVFYKSVS